MSGSYAYVPRSEIAEYGLEEKNRINGVKKVLVFCFLIIALPATLIIAPLYLKKKVFADVIYPVAESDIIEIRDGISSVFCQQHTLQMSSNFNAFQLRSKPEISGNHKHIRLKKSMTLPDDTLEYWGFYLLKGAKVNLKFCSRYEGSRILVVKGQRELKTCGLLDHNKNKGSANFAKSHEQVKVFFEDITEINVPPEGAMLTKNDNNDINMDLENHAGEDLIDDTYNRKQSNQVDASETHFMDSLKQSTETTPKKKLKKGTTYSNHKDFIKSIKNKKQNGNRKFSRNENRKKARKDTMEQLFSPRTKRDQLYDRKYTHGGNAVNFTETDESNSVSSFETGLFECYNGDILLAEGFNSAPDCLSTDFLEFGSHRMVTNHDILQDGYYYYIFYSDNDAVRNDIHAIFDIYKPTFQYSSLNNAQGCVNSTNCTFTIGFLSDEIVIVEVPTRDGIEHEDDDITYLVSICHPRIEIYVLFPITILILILVFSFI